MNNLSPTQQKRLEDLLLYANELEQPGTTQTNKNAFIKSYIDVQHIFPQLRHLHNIPQLQNILRYLQAKKCQPQLTYNSGCSSCGGGGYHTPSGTENCYSEVVINSAKVQQNDVIPKIIKTIRLLYTGKINSNIISV